MSEMTEGPWRAVFGSDDMTGKPPAEIIGPTGHPIAHVLRPERGGCPWANARCLAAAPDLLAALRLLLCAVPSGGYFARLDPRGIGPGVGESVDAAKEKARAAVRKATGECRP